jgi:hypothetical protein
LASYQTLKTALKLLTTPDPEAVDTDVFKLENLSSEEKKDLKTQLQKSQMWKLGRKRNIVGFGIVEKHKGGLPTEELALAVYVKKKYPLSYLNHPGIVPSELEFPGLSEQVITDVREIGVLRLEAALTTAIRPIMCGYSIGRSEKGNTGTLGCMVTTRDTDGKWLLLSNSHVLAYSGLGKPGDPVFQPGPDDWVNPGEPVANLESWQPFKFTNAFDNRVDAALAEPINQELFDPTIFSIGRPKGIRFAERGMTVQKSGRTSGHPWGQIADVDFSAPVPYPEVGTTVKYCDLIVCSRCTEPGDSGALVLDADCYAVGLHFCGTETVSVFNPIQYVLDELNIDLVM